MAKKKVKGKAKPKKATTQEDTGENPPPPVKPPNG